MRKIACCAAVLFYGIFLLLVLPGCEKTVDFDMRENPPKLVVEATIEYGQPPVVVLSTSLQYFSTLSPDSIYNSFVHDAEVTVSNGQLTHRLKEYSVPFSGGYLYHYYSVDSSQLSTAFVGELNHNYYLSISWQGKEYTANTTVPDYNKKIDSLWWLPPPDDDPKNVVVMVRATDPPGYGDYVRYFTRTNRGRFLPGPNSVFDDLFIDGTTYELQVDPGMDRNRPTAQYTRLFHRGDTVTFKLSGIDRATYDFWRTMEFSYQSVGNPFSTPVKVLGNISNGALGYFGGYASQYRTIIIPK
ncbi:MAG: DUF4249 domain-containing protein [Flavisolibacter sp.]